MTDPWAQTVRDALLASGAATEDCPALFDRVSTGVRRRRARRTIGSVAAIVVLGAALALPTLDRASYGHSAVSADGFDSAIATPTASSADDPACPGVPFLPANAYLRHSEGIGETVGDPTSCSGGAAAAADPTIAEPVTRHYSRRFDGLQP